jgi:hypothetical protein
MKLSSEIIQCRKTEPLKISFVILLSQVSLYCIPWLYEDSEIEIPTVFDFPEEAVNEVKRQAVAELQKAVATAESKASEMVAAERQKMERAMLDARKQAQDELLRTVNHQEESSEVCNIVAHRYFMRKIYILSAHQCHLLQFLSFSYANKMKLSMKFDLKFFLVRNFSL